MKLPRMKYSDGIKKAAQIKFGGYNHNLYAGEGELFDMENMSSLYSPLLSPRPPRYLLTTLTKGNGLYARDKLCWVDGTTFYYNGVSEGTVADSLKTFAALGAYIIILPDKKYYNTAMGIFGSLEATYTGAATFQDGTLFGEAADANTIYNASVIWSTYFEVGDGVTISGCVTLTGNNKTPIIREIDDTAHTMSFYENVFTNGTEAAVTIKRAVPDMDFICTNENRLWGCKGDTIYASKLGDPFNWNVFDGVSTDSYSVDVGSADDFTGCVSHLGYPIFFKPRNIYKVYGSIPSNFQVMVSATLGCEDASGAGFAVAEEVLFYLSRAGIVGYSGGMPSPVSEAFGNERYYSAAAGSDGLKYYVSMKDSTDAWHLFVYDTAAGLWHREDSSHALAFAYAENNLHMLASDGKIWVMGNVTDPPAGATAEAAVSSFAEFGDFTEGDPNKKGFSKLQIRAELDTGATLTVQIKLDGAATWTTIKSLTAASKQSYNIPIIPQRADHYRLRLTGTGAYRIYSMAREFYSGSEMK